jgi:hypothetical protein
MTDYAAKMATTLLYTDIPQAVDRHPAAAPIAIARGLVDRMTYDEAKVILEQLISHRVETCQKVARNRLSEYGDDW